MTIFKVLRDPVLAAELERRLRLTPFARDEFEECTAVGIASTDDDVEKARRMIFRSFAGFGSAATNPDYNTGFRCDSHRSHTTPALDWKNFPDVVPAFTARLQGVVIENQDARDVIKRHDGMDTLHYIDPPYVHSTRSPKRRRKREYEYEMDDAAHRDLADCLRNLRGMVVLSGYSSPLYDMLYGDWPQVSFHARADGARSRNEVLWFNPLAWSRRYGAAGFDFGAMGSHAAPTSAAAQEASGADRLVGDGP